MTSVSSNSAAATVSNGVVEPTPADPNASQNPSSSASFANFATSDTSSPTVAPSVSIATATRPFHNIDQGSSFASSSRRENRSRTPPSSVPSLRLPRWPPSTETTTASASSHSSRFLPHSASESVGDYDRRRTASTDPPVPPSISSTTRYARAADELMQGSARRRRSVADRSTTTTRTSDLTTQRRERNASPTILRQRFPSPPPDGPALSYYDHDSAAGGRGGSTATARADQHPSFDADTVASSACTFSPSSDHSLTWYRIVPDDPGTSRTPRARSGAASVVIRDSLYLFGGYGGDGRLDDFHRYDLVRGGWSEVAVRSGSRRPGPRENNGAVVVGGDADGMVYLFGGYDGTRWLNDLWVYDIDRAQWECVMDPSPEEEKEIEHTGIEEGEGKIPSRRFGYVSFVHDRKFVLWGGYDGTRWLNDMYAYHFDEGKWTQVQAGGRKPSVRSCPAWAKDENYVYIHGGYDGIERKADFFALDLRTFVWHEVPCHGSPPSPRYFHSCCLYGSKMYAYGGYSGSERLSDMHAYDFDTGQWSVVEYREMVSFRGESNTNTSTGASQAGDCHSPPPSGRSSLVAQVYGNNLYVFGGYNGQVVLNDFYRFRLRPVDVPPACLVQDLGRLVDCPEFADVVFEVGGRRVYANRALLAVRSEYFRALLYGSRDVRGGISGKDNWFGGMKESVVGSRRRIALGFSSHAVDSGRSSERAGGGVYDGDYSGGVVDDVKEQCVSDKDGFELIVINDVDHAVFIKLLEYLYTDKLENLTMDLVIPLLILR
mmetsp:Transcript_14994/g.33439  ORF Transcript_14994/g.33439 Transcript_14994/m.33439 type:complete len:774 (-) Transcript_14994:927-3248(-)